MKWHLVLGAAVVLSAAASVQAQIGAYRRLTQSESEVRGYDHRRELPLGWKAVTGRPGEVPHGVPVALWFQQPFAAKEEKPDRVVDGAKYVLERLELTGKGAERKLVAVVTRRPALPEGFPAPALQFVDATTAIAVPAAPSAKEEVQGGTRFTFEATPPMLALAPEAQRETSRISDHYELRFVTAGVSRVPTRPTRR